jgi:hypothetical protein
MTFNRKLIGIVILAIGTLAAAYYYWYSASLFSSGYTDDVVEDIVSPGGLHRGQVLVRNQGAFSSFNTVVAVSPAGNDAKEIVAVCRSSRTIDISWVSATELRVVAPADCEKRPHNAPPGILIRFESTTR